MAKLSIRIQSFEDLRKNNYQYIDKTKYIWNLVNTGKVYFLSRPRRFGKSLLLSTIESYFKGKKELFEGLAIESLENKSADPWEKYPVIKIDLAGGIYTEEGGLEDALQNSMRQCAINYGVNYSEIEAGTVSSELENLIQALRRKMDKNVVVLIDEYDKPLLDNMVNNALLEEKNRDILKGYYGQLKKQDEFIKFIFITGVTKFSKVSIFSDLNQLKDISLKPEYSGICGISEEEMKSSYFPEINSMAESMSISTDDCIEKLRSFYDGYHFSESGEGVYNPFSLLNAFSDQKLNMYWFSTGTPSFLIRAMKENEYSLQDLSEGVEEDADIMIGTLYDEYDFLQLLYQAGYLSITGYDSEGHFYKLGFPNREVEYGFEKSLVPYVLYGLPNKRIMLIDKIVSKLKQGEYEAFLNDITALFASIPYPEGQEPYLEREWRNQLYLIFKLIGQRVSTEVHSSKGRCDSVVETDKYIYIFEFKLDKTADEALKQIDDMGYAKPYALSEKKVIKLGINFSTKERNIESWKIEE